MAVSQDTQKFIDPVCGMEVDPLSAAGSTCYNGIHIYFCAPACQHAFEAAPQKYVQSKRKGFWRRYLERLSKSTGGVPPACH